MLLNDDQYIYDGLQKMLHLVVQKEIGLEV